MSRGSFLQSGRWMGIYFKQPQQLYFEKMYALSYYASELFDDEGVVEDILSFFPMEEDFLLEDDLPRM